MAVQEESYGRDEARITKRQTSVAGIRRAKNGDWHVNLEVEVEAVLPDGRTVRAKGKARVKGRAEHKPHPSPTWLHEEKEELRV